MTGIMETILAEVQATRQLVQQLAASVAPAPVQPQPLQAASGLVGLGVSGAVPPPPPPPPAPVMGSVTADMITALVTPILEAQGGRELLRAEMAAMGIEELPKAPPEKWGELYQRFQSVATRLQQAAPQPTAMPGII